MCLSNPGRVLRVEGDFAHLEDGRVVKSPIPVAAGDYVLSALGVIVRKIGEEDYRAIKDACPR